MLLSKYNLKNANTQKVTVPIDSIFDMEEKVLQFGTGVLMRGLPDYLIDKANRQGIFNGRIVVVKSTDRGDAGFFDKQDGLYTLCIRGIENGEKVEENIVCSAISRVLSAKHDWDAILKCAHNPQMQIIISNTTEVGIQLVNEDIRQHPPVSFPGKLLAFLLERYVAFDGSHQSGMVIVPTELISDNAGKLKSIVLELAHLNALDKGFVEWIENCNHFCSSLVDRIVPGSPDDSTRLEVEKELGATDELITVSEVYRLWAIEGGDEVAKVLSFAKADEGLVIASDINLFKELKLRLLNATHTLSAGVAFLAGIATTKEAMTDEKIGPFITELALKEIAPAIPYEVSLLQAQDFGTKVLDRFRNPFVQHQWLSITMNYSLKLKVRAIPVLATYYERFLTFPENFATSFAAYLLFMKPVRKDGTSFYGSYDGKEYLINDDKAAMFFDLWQHHNEAAIVNQVLRDTDLWDEDLTKFPGFEKAVRDKLTMIVQHGMLHTLQTKKELQLK